MENVYDALAARCRLLAAGQPAQLLVGVAGAPGSGKSTLAAAVAAILNEGAGAEVAAVLPMDGFHLTLAQLAAMDDPEEARKRRGAPWTFDGTAFAACVAELRERGAVAAPGFDHGTGDPEPGKHVITPEHRVVLVEGNYVLMEDAPWAGVKPLLDETWFVDASTEAACERVLNRHMRVGRTYAVAAERVETNDRLNALLIREQSRGRADVLVPSLPLSEQQQQQPM